MFAVLHVPNFALQSVLRTEPGAQTRPAALFADNTKKSVVLEANARALSADVERGMTAPQAVARCPDLLIRVPNADAETDARAALLAVGFTVSPCIEDTAPGVCTIDLKGSERRVYEQATRAAVDQLTSLGFAASAGIGETPLVALYAARAASAESHSGENSCHRDRTGAASRAAITDPAAATTETGNPTGAQELFAAESANVYHRNGAPVLLISDAQSFLRGLPLGAADPSPNLVSILATWGLRSLGDLVALSRDDIGKRLGPEGLALWDRAHGGETRPLRPVAPPEAFAAAMEFEEEVETLEPLLFILRRFLERLTLELRTSGYVAAELSLTLQLADETRHERSFRLPEATADTDILFRALHTHLESLRTEAPIAGLQLRAIPARPLVRQQGLFETGLRDPHGFAETLARVVAIVGSERVGTPAPQDTHRPDAVKLVPPAPVIPTPAPPLLHPIMGLPLRRYRPPLRAQLELAAAGPSYLWTDAFHGAVTEIRGPWLSSGEWWQTDRAWRRTEYDVVLDTGGMYRLVLSERNWFIEGEYD